MSETSSGSGPKGITVKGAFARVLSPKLLTALGLRKTEEEGRVSITGNPDMLRVVVDMMREIMRVSPP